MVIILLHLELLSQTMPRYLKFITINTYPCRNQPRWDRHHHHHQARLQLLHRLLHQLLHRLPHQPLRRLSLQRAGNGDPTMTPTIAPTTVPTQVPTRAPTVAPTKKPVKASVSKKLIQPVKASENANQLFWNPVKNADGYFIYASARNENGKERKVKKIADIKNRTTTSYTHKNCEKIRGINTVLRLTALSGRKNCNQ